MQRKIGAMILGCFILSTIYQAQAGIDVSVPLAPKTPIPNEGYKSWSIFITCDPFWMDHQSKNNIEDLYKNFRLFGQAIGDQNAAIWFKQSAQTPQTKNDFVDTARNVQFCQRFELTPSESPFVLVTTLHPDTCAGEGCAGGFPTSTGGRHYRVSLRGLDAEEIRSVLSLVRDQVVASSLNQKAIDSELWWRDWAQILLKVKQAAGAVAATIKKVKIDLSAPPFVSLSVEAGSQG